MVSVPVHPTLVCRVDTATKQPNQEVLSDSLKVQLVLCCQTLTSPPFQKRTRSTGNSFQTAHACDILSSEVPSLLRASHSLAAFCTCTLPSQSKLDVPTTCATSRKKLAYLSFFLGNNKHFYLILFLWEKKCLFAFRILFRMSWT